jgi:hypothetical protein
MSTISTSGSSPISRSWTEASLMSTTRLSKAITRTWSAPFSNVLGDGSTGSLARGDLRGSKTEVLNQNGSHDRLAIDRTPWVRTLERHTSSRC